MLSEHELWVLGKTAVDGIRVHCYGNLGSDIISNHPEILISYLDAVIARLERVKDITVKRQKAREEEERG